jgi:hypothetical protein
MCADTQTGTVAFFWNYYLPLLGVEPMMSVVRTGDTQHRIRDSSISLCFTYVKSQEHEAVKDLGIGSLDMLMCYY